MSNPVKRRERWYLKPREVKGRLGLTAPGPRTPQSLSSTGSTATHGAERWGLQEAVFWQKTV